MDELMEAPHMILWKERLRQERIQRNWRQHDLAQHLGTSVATIQRWERGSHQPSVYFRVKLCALYGKNAQELGLIPGNSPSPSSSTHEAGTLVAKEQAVSVQSTMPVDNSRPPATLPVKLHDPAIPFYHHKEQALVGRSDEMCLLKRYLLTNAGSLALYGLPGIGKTTLASALAHDSDIAAHFHDGILWAGLGRAPDRLRLLSRWGSLLGLTSPEMATTRPRHPDVLAEMLRDAIGTRRMLLILDDAWEATAALDYQIGGEHCVHLVTTRFPPLAWHFAGEQAFPLRELNEQNSMTLLQQLAPVVVSACFHEAQELIRAVGGLPLALALMGKYLQVQTHDRQPRRLHKALKQLFSIDTRLRLSMPQPPMHHHPSLPIHAPLSLQAAIEISEQQLAPQARERFCTLSVFPAKPNSFSEAAALSVCGLSETDLDQYSDAGLLESQSPGRYTLHQVIADYAQQLCARTSVEERMVNFFVALIHTYQYNHDLLEQECTNILAAFELALHHGMASELEQGVNRFAPFLIARGLYTLGERYLNQAQQAALSKDNDEEMVRSCFHRGRIAQLRGDLPLAEHHYLEGLTSARKLAHEELICQLLAYAGETIISRGDWRRAECYLQEGLALAQEAGNQRIAGIILRNLGEIADDYLGDPAQGNARYLQGLELARQVNDWEAIGALLQNLGGKAEWNGAYAQADKYYQEGMACARRIHDVQRISALLMNLGMLSFRQNDYAQAEACYLEALNLAQKIENRLCESGILQNLGMLAAARKHWNQAETYLQESLEIASGTGHAWLRSETLKEIGELYLQQQRIDEAEEVFQEALSKAEDLGAYYLKACALYGLARVKAARNNFGEAYRKGNASQGLFAMIEHAMEKRVGEWLAQIRVGASSPGERVR